MGGSGLIVSNVVLRGRPRDVRASQPFFRDRLRPEGRSTRRLSPAGSSVRSGSGLLRPYKLGSVSPDAVQDHGDLAGCGNSCLLEALSCRQPYRPGLQRREPPHLADQASGRLEQERAHRTVAAFRDASRIVGLAGLVSPWCQAEEGADIARSSKPIGVVDACDEAQRHHRSHAGHRHQAACERDLPADRMELGFDCSCRPAQGLVGRPEALRQDRQHRIIFTGRGELVAEAGAVLAPKP